MSADEDAKVPSGAGASVDIHDAVQNSQEDEIKQYVAQGGDLEARDKDHCTPLHVAAAGGLLDVCQYLGQKGAV